MYFHADFRQTKLAATRKKTGRVRLTMPRRLIGEITSRVDKRGDDGLAHEAWGSPMKTRAMMTSRRPACTV